MADLFFHTDIAWTGVGAAGQGRVEIGGDSVRYSAPAGMGGKGVGTSPEELLLAAVATCYSSTLFGVLARSGLPVQAVGVRVEGIVTGYPLNAKFATLRVNSKISGGNSERGAEYKEKAEHARNRCFIGKTIAGNVEYLVGDVQVLPDGAVSSAVTQ